MLRMQLHKNLKRRCILIDLNIYTCSADLTWLTIYIHPILFFFSIYIYVTIALQIRFRLRDPFINQSLPIWDFDLLLPISNVQVPLCVAWLSGNQCWRTNRMLRSIPEEFIQPRLRLWHTNFECTDGLGYIGWQLEPQDILQPVFCLTFYGYGDLSAVPVGHHT